MGQTESLPHPGGAPSSPHHPFPYATQYMDAPHSNDQIDGPQAQGNTWAAESDYGHGEVNDRTGPPGIVGPSSSSTYTTPAPTQDLHTPPGSPPGVGSGSSSSSSEGWTANNRADINTATTRNPPGGGGGGDSGSKQSHSKFSKTNRASANFSSSLGVLGSGRRKSTHPGGHPGGWTRSSFSSHHGQRQQQRHGGSSSHHHSGGFINTSSNSATQGGVVHLGERSLNQTRSTQNSNSNSRRWGTAHTPKKPPAPAPPPTLTPPGSKSPPGGGGQSQSRLPSTQLKRHRRLSAGTSSSLGSLHTIPTIKVTSDSELDNTTAISDFDPDKSYYSGYYSGGHRKQRTSTPKTDPRQRAMDLSVSNKFESAASASYSESNKREGSISPGRFFGLLKGRRNSASSDSSTSSKKSKKERKSSAQLRLQKGLSSQNDPKADAANKWKNIVNEFEEVYNDDFTDPISGQRTLTKEVKKVSKLGNLEQYENVRQVFNKSMPLPMQMAPPGAKAEELEAEMSAASEISSNSWNLMTPMGMKGQQEAMSAQAQQMGQSGRTLQGFGMAETTRMSGTVGEMSATGSAQTHQAAAAARSASRQQEASSSSLEASNFRERTSSQASNFRERSSSHAAAASSSASASASGSAVMMGSSGSRPSSRAELHQEMHMQMSDSRPSSRQSSRSSNSRQSRSASRSGSRSQMSASASDAGMHQHKSSSSSSKSAKRKQSSSMQSGSSMQSSASAKAASGNRKTMVQSRKMTVEQLRKSDGGKSAIAAAEKREQMRKGVKFKRTRIDKQAKIIVDDAINSAMRLVYGDSKKSSSHKSSSRARSSSHVEKRIEQHIEEHVHHKKAAAARASLARKKSVIPKKEIRSQSMRPMQGKTGEKQEQGGMRPAGGKTGGGDTPGLYDMVIQPHGEVIQPQGEVVKSEAEMEWYRRLKEGPRNRADTNATTSIKVYHRDSSNGQPPALPAYQERSSESYKRSTVVDPPTITRGTVTRVFHELDTYGQMPASMLLAQLQSLNGSMPEEGVVQQQQTSGGYSMEYSYTSLGMAPPSGLYNMQNNIVAPSVENTTPYGTPLPPAVLVPPTDGYLSPIGYSTLQSHNSGGFIGGPDSGPQSILLGNIPGGYIDDTIVLSPPLPQSPVPQDMTSFTMHSFRSRSSDLLPNSPHVDVRDDTGQILRSLPIMLPQGNNRLNDSFMSLPALLDSGDFNSEAYSNEPLIVADLMDRPVQPQNFYSLDRNPHVNMNKQQVLNFYVFGQKGKEPKGQEVQVRDMYFGDEDSKKVVSQGVQAQEHVEPEMPDLKKYTIYHKQTQTLPPPQPKSPPPKARSPPRVIEKKKETIIKKIIPRAPSPERPRSPVVHRETHHYITKERQIEKLPPPPAAKSEFCVQTDMTGRDWEDEVDSLHRALTDAERRALEAERAMEEMHASNAAIHSVVREIEEVVHEQERLPTPPPPPVREIPVSMEIVKITPEPEPELEPEPEEPEEDEDEEFYEWTEVEEREQRLSMAIFEEIEFNLQRKQGGQTTTVESGKSSELIPWAIPQQYEAVVDRRRQKMTQVRDIHREGDDIVVQAGSNIPALTQRLSEQTLEDRLDGRQSEPLENPAESVKEQRDVTLRRQKNVTSRPMTFTQRHSTNSETSSPMTFTQRHSTNSETSTPMTFTQRPSTNSEVNIKINRGGDELASRRHFSTAMDYNPKRNYMSTFDHEMDRSRNRISPPRVTGRTSTRSHTHIPRAAANSKYNTSLLSSLAGMAPQSMGNNDTSGGSKHSTTIVRGHTNHQGPSSNSIGFSHSPKGGGNTSKHSTTIIRDSLSNNVGHDEFDSGINEEPGRKYITTYSQEKSGQNVMQPSSSSHSSTYVTSPKGQQIKEGGSTKEHHITTYTRQVKGGGTEGDASNSSGYSSADNTSHMRIDRLRGFEIPFDASDENTRYLTEADIHLARPQGMSYSQHVESGPYSASSERSKRHVSRFDPGNIYFTVPQWTPVESSELLFNMTNNSKHSGGEARHHSSIHEHLLGEHDNDSLPDALPGVEAEHMKRKSMLTTSDNQHSPPKVRSEYVEDEDGNLMKITTTEQKMTKTVDYVSESESPKVGRAIRGQSDEALMEESFVELDLTTTEQFDEVHEEAETHGEQLSEQFSEQVRRVSNSESVSRNTVDEVMSETSVGYKKIEYDDQERSLGLGHDDMGALEFQDSAYLYDMRTATLRPSQIKDDGELLSQYSLGDSMVTEL